MDINNLLTLPESKTLEFKQDLSSLKPILKTIVGFANTAGGIIIIGFSPEKGILGIEDILQAEESLTSSISDSISPALQPEVDIKTIDGKNLLIVRVAHQRGPYFLKAEGAIEGVYMRFGSSSRKAGPEILEDLMRHTQNLSFDQLPCADLSIEDLNENYIAAFLKKIGKSENDQSALKTLGILTSLSKKLVPTNGGILLFGHDDVRNRYFSDARISCARFKGIDKVHFIDRQDIEGSPLEALESVLKFIARHTSVAGIIRSFIRKDIHEFPPIAIRETLLNAIIHCNYAVSGKIFIAIFDDRLEVQSPGMLPYGMTLDDFKSGVSHIRNRVIARVFRELGYIEEWGSGYKRITEYCKEFGYPIPKWEEFGMAIRVTFLRNEFFQESNLIISKTKEKIKKDLSSRQTEILDILSHRGELKMREILENLKDPPAERTLRDDLAKLRENGLIDFKGQTRSSTWFLINKHE